MILHIAEVVAAIITAWQWDVHHPAFTPRHRKDS
jgi:hypothetical protein